MLKDDGKLKHNLNEDHKHGLDDGLIKSASTVTEGISEDFVQLEDGSLIKKADYEAGNKDLDDYLAQKGIPTFKTNEEREAEAKRTKFGLKDNPIFNYDDMLKF